MSDNSNNNECCKKSQECEGVVEEKREEQNRGLTQEEREEILNQIQVVDQSLHFILVIIIAISINFCTTKVNRAQLVCSLDSEACNCECLPDTCNLRIVSSMLIIISLIFFFNLANETNRNTNTPASCRNKISSELVLIAALLRFFDLMKECCICDACEKSETC